MRSVSAAENPHGASTASGGKDLGSEAELAEQMNVNTRRKYVKGTFIGTRCDCLKKKATLYAMFPGSACATNTTFFWQIRN